MTGNWACDNCAYYMYDEDTEEWICDANMDEDDFASLLQGNRKACPYFRNGDEYAVVRKQL